jgi:hypothetical protein
MRDLKDTSEHVSFRICSLAAAAGIVMMLSLSSLPVAAQTPKQPLATASYECAANTHCTVSCLVDGDKVVQTGSPRSVTVSLLARNNYLVELVEENGQIHYAYFAGAKVVCALDGVTRKGG